MLIESLVQQLKRDEGVSLKLYQDTVGKWTIGVGRNLQDNGISQIESDVLLGNDIQEHTLQLEKALPWVNNLDPIRKAALVNMAFNMGVSSLLKFKNTLSLIQQHQWPQAAQEMLKSVWASQVGDRAYRLSEQIRLGEWR